MTLAHESVALLAQVTIEGDDDEDKSNVVEETDGADNATPAAAPVTTDTNAMMDFGKKKKAKKPIKGVDESDGTAGEQSGIAGTDLIDYPDWPDWTYDEVRAPHARCACAVPCLPIRLCACAQLLNRVFDIMREKNPALVTGEKKRFVMKPPQASRVGTKKTAFTNFADICRL